MTTNTKPEVSLIQTLNDVRQALVEERDSLLSRAAEIDAALGVIPTNKPAQKPVKAPKATSTPRTGGIKEQVLGVVAATPQATIKQIQELLPDASATSVESVVHGLVGTGQLIKDSSTPRKFTLASAAPVPEVKTKSNSKTNGASIANGA